MPRASRPERSSASSRVQRPSLVERVGQPNAGPGSLEIDAVASELDLRRPEHLERHVLDELLDPLHRVPVVGVGLVPLEHRELGLVLVGDALVAKVLAELVDALEPADDEALEVELGRDAQVEVGVELVRVRDERPGERAAVTGLKDGGLDLDEAAFVEPAADGRDEPRAQDEVPPGLLVDGEVEVAPAVAGLDVCQPVVDVGQRAVDLRERDELVDGERGLAPFRTSRSAHRADDVPEIDVDRPAAILGAQQLDPTGAVDEIEERQLAVTAPGEDAPGDAPAQVGLLTRARGPPPRPVRRRSRPGRGNAWAGSRHRRAYREAPPTAARMHASQ